MVRRKLLKERKTIQEGLVPVFNSPFYVTPNTPADPTDCDRYPNSPYCGENPLSLKFAAIEPSIVFDSCNLGIQLNLTLGFIKLPPVQIVYRNPNCIPTVEEPPPEPVIIQYVDRPAVPEGNCEDGLNFYVITRNLFFTYFDGITRSLNSISNASDYEFSGQGWQYSKVTVSLESAVFPPELQETVKTIRVTFKATTESLIFNPRLNNQPTITESLFTHTIPRNHPRDAGTQLITLSGIIGGVNTTLGWIALSQQVLQDNILYGFLYNYSTVTNQQQSDYIVNFDVLDSFINVVTPFRQYSIVISNCAEDSFGNIGCDASWDRLNVTNQQISLKLVCSDYIKERGTFPPPPPRKECCKMGCCPNNSNVEQLLRLILKKIGSTDLPAFVPNSLTKKNSGTTQIQNLAQFIAYSIKQTNNQFGQFPQEIKIEDADLTQEGNQERAIELPNLAESIAEIVGILLVLQSESNANLIATVNAMIEAGSAKQAAILAGDHAAANSEFLGYKGKQVERQVPFTFKPGEQQLDKMLQPGEVKVKGFDNDDKNDLNDVLVPLLEMAAMYRAANYRNVGTSDPLGKLGSILRGAADISTVMSNLSGLTPPPDPNNPNAPSPEPKKNDWDSFVENAESGFITQPGITDTTNPYGRPFAQRPKIREIGNDTSEST
ncbi:MAG: hypothetical protein KME23_17670 [Goleter apudmare HA4340-LM2]|jgi:hypothetical protein|nr:hypothetical protein [Goleter apudmare HA4340-LM2]MBW4644790.1 hypothetical protein [Goleter apudmare HA4340-LM2]